MNPHSTEVAVMAEVDHRATRYLAEARRARLIRLARRPRRRDVSPVKRIRVRPEVVGH